MLAFMLISSDLQSALKVGSVIQLLTNVITPLRSKLSAKWWLGIPKSSNLKNKMASEQGGRLLYLHRGEIIDGCRHRLTGYTWQALDIAWIITGKQAAFYFIFPPQFPEIT